MSTKTLLSYAHAFLVAADQHAQAARAKGVDGEVEGMMAVIALQNAAVGATRVLGKQHPAVLAQMASVPDLKDVRDMLTHFDEYALGNGKLQRPVADGHKGPCGWMPMWNSPEAVCILTRRRGDAEPRVYEVRTHEALVAVAHLVAAAADALGVTRSPLLVRLSGQGSPASNQP